MATAESMPSTEALKAEIAAEMDSLSDDSLRTLADFVSFLSSKAQQRTSLGDEQAAVQRYIAGYKRYPETPSEVAATWAVNQVALAEEPWE